MSENIELQLGVITEQLQRAREDIKNLDSKIDNNYVTKTEFEPVQKLVYGLVGLILTSVVGALLYLVIQHDVR